MPPKLNEEKQKELSSRVKRRASRRAEVINPSNSGRRPGLVHKPTKQEIKAAHARLKSKHPNISIDEMIARSSALAPTRLALILDEDSLLKMLAAFATLISYEMQSRCSAPLFASGNPNSYWNPSLVNAYLISITTAFLTKVGAMPASSTYQVMGEFVIPTFIAKWLQQMAPVSHMGRRIVPSCNLNADYFLNQDCGTGGLGQSPGQPATGFANAPCFVEVGGDTEGWWSVTGSGATAITPSTVPPGDYERLSDLLTRTFVHTVPLSKVGLEASSTELKVTRVGPGVSGDFAYSCVDSKTMCDLILPLAGMYSTTLVNGVEAIQVSAPVRIDGGFCVSPESKVAFMFHLANKHKYRKKDSFRGYLRDFGLPDVYMGNAVINMRQINWVQVFSLTMIYCATITNVDPKTCWYLCCYIATVIVSNIPGCFRAISPFRRDYSVAPLYKETSLQPCYAAFCNNPKLPPFIAQIVKSLREPIRYENQITFYVNVLPNPSDPNWWSFVATSSNNNLGSNADYGKMPSVPSQTGLAWSSGPYQPYPGAQIGGSTPISYPDGQRNYIPLFGMAQSAGYFQRVLTMPNGDQNLFNMWNAKAVSFTKRHAKYFIPSVIDSFSLGYPSANQGQGPAVFTINSAYAKLIMSNEPAAYHASLLAVGNLLGYYSPSTDAAGTIVPLVAPTFSAQPVQSVASCAATAMAAANLGQGSQQAIAAGTSKNPQEVQAHLAAESLEGVVTNAAQPVTEESATAKVKKSIISKVKTCGETVLKDAGEAGKDLVQGALAVL